MAATKKVTARKAAKDDGVYWVVSCRNKLFGWTPTYVFKTLTAATDKRDELENTSVLSWRFAKVDRVQLGK